MILKKIKVEYYLLGMFAVGLFLIDLSFFRQLNFVDNMRQLQKGERVEIFAGDVIKQKFISNKDNLSNLKILFGNKALKEGSSLEIVLAGKNCEKRIAETTIKGVYKFDSKYLYDFKFQKINNSKDKEYCLKVGLETESEWTLLRKIKSKFKTEKKRGPQKVRLFEQVSNEGETKNYIIEGTSGNIKAQGENEIFFQQGYRNDKVMDSFRQLNQRMSQYKPWFLKGLYLQIISWLAILLSFGGVVNMILRWKR